jgi:hypothetical protein
VPGTDAPAEVRPAAPDDAPTAAPVDAPTASCDLPPSDQDAAAVAASEGTPHPDPPADDVWSEEPWPANDPWATATVMPRDAGEREPPAPAQAGPAPSAGSEPRGLDLLRSVFPGRVLQVVGNASEAAVDRVAGTASSEPLDPDEAILDPDEAVLDPEPGGPT